MGTLTPDLSPREAMEPQAPASPGSDADRRLGEEIHDAQDAQPTREERIRQAAYERYERRGGVAGNADQDWLNAERDVDGPDPNRVA